MVRRLEVLSGIGCRDQSEPQGVPREGAPEKAGSGVASRRTETGYEALPTRASGPLTVYRELSARGAPEVAGSEGGALRPQLVRDGRTRRDAHGSAGELLRAARTTPAGRTDLNSLNRRMRTRMFGGVGGE
jgi:hypothetical protein